jgi:glutamate carboxypeptidase
MTSHADQATAWLSGRRAAMETDIARLVEVNSYTENPAGGRQVATLLQQLLSMPGLDATVHPGRRFADHLTFASRGDARRGGPVALVGHLDTVFPPGSFEGYRVDGDRARGPGVLDMKGGLVVMAYALRALAETGSLDAVAPVRMIVVSDEEVGSPEGESVLRPALEGASACLVFEAGRVGDAVITRRKGVGAMTATARGRAAHAGNAHHEGANAVWALARFIDAAQGLTRYDRGATVNVGRVSGGIGPNTVPEQAEAQLDLRFCVNEDGGALVDAIRRGAADAAASVPGTAIDLQGGILRPPLERTEASGRLFEAYAACARAHGLGGAEAPLVGGGSDASTAGVMGVPAIDGLGPRGAGFHTRDEYIELASLVPKAQALARFLAGHGAAAGA